MSENTPESITEEAPDDLMEAIEEAERNIRREIVGLKKMVSLRIRKMSLEIEELKADAGRLRERVVVIESRLGIVPPPELADPFPDAHG